MRILPALIGQHKRVASRQGLGAQRAGRNRPQPGGAIGIGQWRQRSRRTEARRKSPRNAGTGNAGCRGIRRGCRRRFVAVLRDIEGFFNAVVLDFHRAGIGIDGENGDVILAFTLDQEKSFFPSRVQGAWAAWPPSCSTCLAPRMVVMPLKIIFGGGGGGGGFIRAGRRRGLQIEDIAIHDALIGAVRRHRSGGPCSRHDEQQTAQNRRHNLLSEPHRRNISDSGINTTEK